MTITNTCMNFYFCETFIIGNLIFTKVLNMQVRPLINYLGTDQIKQNTVKAKLYIMTCQSTQVISTTM